MTGIDLRNRDERKKKPLKGRLLFTSLLLLFGHNLDVCYSVMTVFIDSGSIPAFLPLYKELRI
jgi:hypothetical protein